MGPRIESEGDKKEEKTELFFLRPEGLLPRASLGPIGLGLGLGLGQLGQALLAAADEPSADHCPSASVSVQRGHCY